jgi:hypothetical protein
MKLTSTVWDILVHTRYNSLPKFDDLPHSVFRLNLRSNTLVALVVKIRAEAIHAAK